MSGQAPAKNIRLSLNLKNLNLFGCHFIHFNYPLRKNELSHLGILIFDFLLKAQSMPIIGLFNKFKLFSFLLWFKKEI